MNFRKSLKNSTLTCGLVLLSLSFGMVKGQHKAHADQTAHQQVQQTTTNNNSDANTITLSAGSSAVSSASSSVASSSSASSATTSSATNSSASNQSSTSQNTTVISTPDVVKPAASASDGTPYVTIGSSYYPRVDAVDISSYQYNLTEANYQALKNAGVKTIIVKLTEGTNYINPYAASQIANARAAGLNIGAYHFNDFSNSAEAYAEGQYFANELKNLGLSTSTPVIADMESSYVKYGNVANDLNSFWRALSAAGYSNHIVYCSIAYDEAYGVSTTVGKKKTWIAQYPYSPSSSNLLNTGYGAWQFNSHGRVSGYNADLDVSIDYSGIFGSGLTDSYQNGNWYLYNGSVKQTGWQQVNGHWYYYNPSNGSGEMLVGDQYINGAWYHLNTNHDGTYGAMVTGWVKENGKWYYYNPSNNDGKLMSGDQYINGHWYYLNPNHDGSYGAMVTGWHEENGKWYYYNTATDTGWMLTDRQYIDGSWYELGSDGARETGLVYDSASQTLHYYGNDGKEETSNWVTAAASADQDGLLTEGADEYKLEDKNTGKVDTGWQKVGGSWYYFDPSTGKATKSQWFHSPAGNWYYFGSDGKAASGITKVGSQTFYFDPTNAWLLSGWQKVNGSWYYFNPYHDGSYGAAKTGWFKSVAGNWFYFDADGKAETGLHVINGRWYDFDVNNAWALKGWQKVNGSWYYFDDTNAWAETGWQHINNRWYHFGQDGKVATGLQSINGHTYYFDADNAWADTGWQKINGSWYYFDGTNAWAMTGWQRINNRWYYFDNTGKSLSGLQTINGHTYYFDPDNAWAVTGQHTINGHVYNFDETNAWAL